MIRNKIRHGWRRYAIMKSRIAICGFGNAGRELARTIIDDEKYELAFALCSEHSSKAGKDAGELLGMGDLGVKIYRDSEFSKAIEESPADIMINFSVTAMSLTLVKMCALAGVSTVVCTTEHSEESLRQMEDAAHQAGVGVVIASNLTIGINVLMKYAADLSKTLPEFDIAVQERHRKGKAPITGTAKQIVKATGREDVPISCVRAGGYSGLHEVTAASANERITIIHESFSRGAFSDGALAAADYIKDRKGFYYMSDVVASR